ncbi:MAG: HD domain-containing protein [Chloroflexi bacterium]|nr:HD domain-containing protein [Chloroflexota bacterium]
MITIEFARTLYPADADSAHDFDHVLRVVQLADRIARAEGANVDIVRAAALLHDIGLDEGRAGHETSAANRSKDILREHGYNEPFVEAVAHAIESHRFRSGPTPQTLEAKVLFDADKLDSIGAIGVARAVAFGAHRGQKLWAAVPVDYTDPMDGREADPNQHTSVHEFHVKLKKIKDRMHTPAGRAIAAERHAYMVGFYEQLDREVNGDA